MSQAQHCVGCEEYGCPGFTTPRATPEPVPALRPLRIATEEERRAALTAIKADLAAIKRKQQEGDK
jgi:hypothetical protein